MTGEAISFREEDHTYHYRGRRVPSVTELISLIAPPRYWDTVAAALGTEVHEATALDDWDDLVEETVSEDARGYLEAWRAFRQKWAVAFPSYGIETSLFHHRLGYAGTVDRYGVWLTQVGLEKPGAFVLDIKTGQHERWHDLQVNAYALALAQQHPDWEPVVRGMLVYLKRDGTFTVREVPIDPDLTTAHMAALVATWNLRKELSHG